VNRAAYETLQPLEPCDLLFVRGSSWFARAILRATRAWGEEPTLISYVALVVAGGPAEEAVIVEAVGRVRRGRLARFYAGREDRLSLARHRSLTADQRRRILARSHRLEGRFYGYGKLPLHLLNAVLCGRRVFRRLARSPLPICSWHVVKSFAAGGVRFGVPAWAAQPDDLWDWCMGREQWRWPWGWRLRGMEEVGRAAAAAGAG
jgi:hypothetical protein